MYNTRKYFLVPYIVAYRLLLGFLVAYNLALTGNDKPRISIITSVYNGDQFIEQFLADITRQTIFDQCELIMINAQSPGNEEPVIKKYMAWYPNIIYKKLDQDPGVYAVWNIAIGMARGEYITNANLDDRLAPICYAVHAAALDADPSIMLVYSDRALADIPNETFEHNTSTRKLIAPEFSPEALYQFCWPLSNPMWRSTMHTHYGMFDESLRYSGDWEMWLRAVSKGAQYKKIDGMYALNYCNPQGLQTAPASKKAKEDEDERIRELYASVTKNAAYDTYMTVARGLEKTHDTEETVWSMALASYLDATGLQPTSAEPLVNIASHYYKTRQMPLMYIFARRACEMAIPADYNEVRDRVLYMYTRYDLLSIAAWHVGAYEIGQWAAQKAYDYNPNDKRLKDNLTFYRSMAQSKAKNR